MKTIELNFKDRSIPIRNTAWCSHNEITIKAVNKTNCIIIIETVGSTNWYIELHLDNEKPKTKETKVVLNLKHHKIKFHGIYTNDVDMVTELILNHAGCEFENPLPVYDSEGFRVLRQKSGRTEDLCVQIYDAEKNDEFIQGLVMLLTTFDLRVGVRYEPNFTRLYFRRPENLTYKDCTLAAFGFEEIGLCNDLIEALLQSLDMYINRKSDDNIRRKRCDPNPYFI